MSDFTHGDCEVLIGDCLSRLKDLPDNSIDCVITSPPYFGLRDYGTADWEGGSDPECDHKIPEVELDPKRCGGDSGSSHTLRFNRESCYKCGAKRIDKQIGLEKTYEEFIDKLVEIFREVRRVLHPNGTFWLNIGDSYAGSGGPGSQYDNKSATSLKGEFKKYDNPNRKVENLKNKDLMMIPARLAIALQEDGWWLRSDIIWHKPSVMPESVRDRPTNDYEHIFLLTKSPKYYYDADAIRRENGSNKRSVWSINPKPYKGAHFAVFPPELIEPCVLAGCPPNGIVLDPFGGSGTTAGVAIKHGRKAILCELNEEYAKLIPNRIDSIVGFKLTDAKWL